MRLRRRGGKRRLRAGQYFARGVAFLVLIAIVGTVRSVFALHALSEARAELIDQLQHIAVNVSDALTLKFFSHATSRSVLSLVA